MEKRTTKPEYIEPLLNTLKKLGKTEEETLYEQTYKTIKTKLYPSDRAILPNGEPRWRYQMQHMLDGLVESGKIIKKEGKIWVNENQRS
ncbi:hypothetical protein GF326_05955 [Candidatus Bathyarchaeota archaeon]|nr:hypothetical protein [Candidatus Bathyarchaeota archaeon]